MLVTMVPAKINVQKAAGEQQNKLEHEAFNCTEEIFLAIPTSGHKMAIKIHRLVNNHKKINVVCRLKLSREHLKLTVLLF